MPGILGKEDPLTHYYCSINTVDETECWGRDTQSDNRCSTSTFTHHLDTDIVVPPDTEGSIKCWGPTIIIK